MNELSATKQMKIPEYISPEAMTGLINQNLEFLDKAFSKFYYTKLTPSYPERILVTFNSGGEVVAVEKKFMERRKLLSEIPEKEYDSFIDQNGLPLYQYAIEPDIFGCRFIYRSVTYLGTPPSAEINEIFHRVLKAYDRL